ncbi:MAG: Gfo/Idh/MocA family oxidoreductase [Promethearchaeota archaeon]
MKKVAIIGTGNLGSRHLQALKTVKEHLRIFVVDPSPDSLNIAKVRYNSLPPRDHPHEVQYYQKIKKFDNEIDLAIVATNSDVRRHVIEQLLKLNYVKYLILEKILFQKIDDYYSIQDLFKEKNCKVWIDCTRRIIPVYKSTIKSWFDKLKILFVVSGSQFGIMSTIIHYIDYMVYLTECDKFTVDTTYLDPVLIQSKRNKFLELTGILQTRFENGSHGVFSCFPIGNLPETIQISTDNILCIINQTEETSWVLNSQNKLRWETFNAKLIYSSILTKTIAEEIFENGDSSLTKYDESMKIHISILEPILGFLNEKTGNRYDSCPFT